VLAGPAVRPGPARRCGQLHHPVAAQPAEQVRRQVRQQPGWPGHVIAGVEDHQDRQVALVPVPGPDQPGDDLADLDGRDLGLMAIEARTARSAES
jgi:hypothetical protein